MSFVVGAVVASVIEDEPLAVEINGQQLAFYLVDGEIYAIDNVCPHQYALLSDGYLENGCIECPLHQARFDVRTGAALCGPVERGVRTYPVKIDGTQVLVDLGA